ncbi:hypothetical protein [Actinomadura litoris]|uniref:hypothetical protein n=1 Tax=Actinomadura litoris TaxID=2678616 RepID=UPI001FA7BD2C|nr:hypothetical protein [Actinomadura litoris]
MSTLAQWEEYFTAAEVSGVVSGLDLTLDSSARAVTVKPGGALVRGIYKPVSVVTSTPVPAPSPQNRVDRLVLRLNRDATAPEAFLTFVVIAGTPAASPTIPAMQQVTSTGGMWDLPIARWTSQASGAFSGLVDERTFLGNAPILYNSMARPTPTRRTLGIEIDTGRITRWDGQTWQAIADDTGWVTLAVNGPDRAAWSANVVNQIRKRNGVVSVRFAVRRWKDNDLTTGDADGSAPFTLLAQFRPSVRVFGSGWHTRAPVAVDIETDGVLRIYPLLADVPAGRTVFGGATYMVDE